MNDQHNIQPQSIRHDRAIDENASPIGNDGIEPSIDAQRDIALAVTVLRNDLGLDSDEALELLVETHVISVVAARVYRARYFAVAKHLREFTERERHATREV